MKVDMKGRSLLTLKDWTPEEVRHVLTLSHRVKKELRSGTVQQRFRGRTLALLFEKRSTRTRCAFETAFGEEGGHPVFLSMADIHLGSKEALEDTARVLGRMFSAIQFRGFKQSTVEALAKWSGVPVYNGLTDDWHPTQALADLMTMEETFGSLTGKKLAFVGDGRNNVAVTLLVGCAQMGVSMSIAAPRELAPAAEHLAWAREMGARTGARFDVTTDAAEGVRGADAVYTDVWVSMGEEEKSAERIALLTPYQVTRSLMEKAGKKESIFLHCLPAVKGKEVTEEVIEGEHSRVWDQAENRKHTIKALMLATI
ncbi:MAG TPA: ornithine carbamoyltransferase [Spirochaetia bacterium]|nr:ornithine carbamoyltransferase [Spirochaetia bacterium]